MKLLRGAVRGHLQSRAKVPQSVIALRNQALTSKLQESKFKLGGTFCQSVNGADTPPRS